MASIEGDESAPRPGRRRRTFAVAVWALVAAAVLGAAGWLAYYRATFHTFAWWSPPPSISYCGRRFDRGESVPGLPAQTEFSRVMTVQPAGWPVYAGGTAAGSVTPAGGGLPCAMGLALERSAHDYVLYGLVGGP